MFCCDTAANCHLGGSRRALEQWPSCNQPTPSPAFDLRISITGTEPEVWRWLQVPETITVPEFHRVLQAAFGWENRHLYGIRCTDVRGEGRVIVGPDEAAEDSYAEPASGVALVELLDAKRTGPADFEYEYDFGDAWTHTLELMVPAELPEKTLRCTDGANRGPVEDSGGSHGFRRIIEVLGDPGHRNTRTPRAGTSSPPARTPQRSRRPGSTPAHSTPGWTSLPSSCGPSRPRKVRSTPSSIPSTGSCPRFPPTGCR
ncbi:plasmid pRiA4b ORF-3 family protein [Arthrobacter sp. FW305-BF8]|uniref:plasmid pRiA4b ORF-3 family protein n=1 Tax=Arthrobacter sp. FW305-BF8 TaxID=2879617 RepID=UPI003FA465F7|nr:plasmid pRiA4b ORF-3 family protein [Arthrobacter sp. FW305-BF8]